jgi:hypothetical protein
MSPDRALPGNGLLLFFRVDDFDEEPHRNPSTQTHEFSLRDPDGYCVTISALSGDQ